MPHSKLNQQDCLLLVVDVQGKLATLMHQPEQYLSNLKIMIQAAGHLDIPILWAEQLPDKLGPTLPEIAELLCHQQPIAKHSFSCFGEEKLVSALSASGKNQILVTGIETHICVYQSVVDLIRLQKQAHVVTDAVASRLAHNKALGLERMRDAGATLTSTEACLFEMMQHAHHPAFREIVKLLK